jgi:hypothetical protein
VLSNIHHVKLPLATSIAPYAGLDDPDGIEIRL